MENTFKFKRNNKLDDILVLSELEFEEAKAIVKEDSLNEFPGWLYKYDNSLGK